MDAPDLATVQVDFTLAIGAGRLDASLDVPAGTVTLTQILPALQTLSSNVIASTVSIVEAEGYSISCRAGCGACCRQMVPLSLFEAEALGAWVAALPIEQRAVLAQRFHTALTAVRDGGMIARMDASKEVDHAEAKALAIDYMRLAIPCPFLENESCSIHPIRPFACREYLVTSPPEFCDDPSTMPVVGVPVPLKLSRLLYKLGAQVSEDRGGWIPLVFLLVWMQANYRPGQAITGPGPEVLYEVVKRLE